VKTVQLLHSNWLKDGRDIAKIRASFVELFVAYVHFIPTSECSLCIRGLRRCECFCDCIVLSSEFAVDSGQYCGISYDVHLLISVKIQRFIAPMNWLKEMQGVTRTCLFKRTITHCKTGYNECCNISAGGSCVSCRLSLTWAVHMDGEVESRPTEKLVPTQVEQLLLVHN
jgi:hypothetical protein